MLLKKIEDKIWIEYRFNYLGANATLQNDSGQTAQAIAQLNNDAELLVVLGGGGSGSSAEPSSVASPRTALNIVNYVVPSSSTSPPISPRGYSGAAGGAAGIARPNTNNLPSSSSNTDSNRNAS